MSRSPRNRSGALTSKGGPFGVPRTVAPATLTGSNGPAASYGVKMPTFSRYQKFVIAILAFLQFTIVLDFMILSPLGALLLRDLGITTSQFGLRGLGLRVQRGHRRDLHGRVRRQVRPQEAAAVLLRGVRPGHVPVRGGDRLPFLLAARIVTGLFGGVIGSISFAIIADLFPFEVARAGDGRRADLVRGQPGAGPPARPLSIEPLRLARPVRA